MPTSTFYNLPCDKRERLMQAIRNEFARVPFNKVSINRIVQEAGIPRGSYYQYFESKDDLFECVVEDMRSMLELLIDDSLSRCGGDPFALPLYAYDSAVSYCSRSGSLGFFMNIFDHIRVKLSDQLVCGTPLLEDIIGILRGKIDLTALDIRSERDVSDTLQLLIMMFMGTLAMSLQHPEIRTEMREAMVNKIEIIKRGAQSK